MIFKPVLVHLILEGKKTMTRRPVKPGEEECRYKTGRAYALQKGRGKPGVAKIEVVKVQRQALGQITFEDARAEGFNNADAFFEYWRELYGLDELNVAQPVWAIRFELVREDTPLFLHRRVHRPYTDDPAQAAHGEGEVLDPSTLHVDWENRAILHQAAAIEDRDSTMLAGLDRPDQRLEALKLLANLKPELDIHDDVRAIEHARTSFDARRDAKLSRLIEQLERKVRYAA